jgi:hypothetical protein
MFREFRLGKNEDPELWINNLEDLRIKLETMGSNMTDDQYIVQVLNILTSDYELQMLLLEKQVGSKDNLFSIEDLKEERNLPFERLSTGQNDNLGKEVLCLLRKNDPALYDYTIISEDITVGNSNVMTATKMGKLRCEILQKNGESLVVTLEDVKFVPDLWINLFSIGKAVRNGFNLGNDGETIKLMKGNTVILFDKRLKSKNGFVPAIKIKAVLADIGATVVNAKKQKPKNSINVNNLYKILGHCGEAGARLTGKALGYKVIGTFDTCEACSAGKAKQKNIKKQRERW